MAYYDDVVVETRTSYLIGRADRVMRSELDRHLTTAGLTVNEVTVLSVLAGRPGLSNAGLARRSLVSPQAMHKVVSSLERAGLIERSSSPDGGRSLLTTITAEGAATLAEAETHLAAAEAAFLEALDARERKQLRVLLRKVTHLDRHGDGPSSP